MTELARQLEVRIDEATRSLTNAQEGGDDYLAETLRSELESLRRVAAEHGIAVSDRSSSAA